MCEFAGLFSNIFLLVYIDISIQFDFEIKPQTVFILSHFTHKPQKALA